MHQKDFIIATVFQNSISEKWNKRFFYAGTDSKEKFLVVLEDHVFLPSNLEGKFTFYGRMSYSLKNQIMKLTVSHFEPYEAVGPEQSKAKIRAILGIA